MAHKLALLEGSCKGNPRVKKEEKFPSILFNNELHSTYRPHFPLQAFSDFWGTFMQNNVKSSEDNIFFPFSYADSDSFH